MTKKLPVKFNFNKIFLIILLVLIPFFQPKSLNDNIAILDLFYNVTRVLASGFVAFLFIKDLIINRKINVAFFIYVFLQVYILINSIIQSGIFKDIFVNCMNAVCLLMIIDYFSRKHPKELISSLLLINEVLLYVNLLIMLIHPEGLNGSWSFHFLGNRNGHIIYMILGLTTALLWSEYSGSKIRYYCLFIACIISLSIGKSMTGIISLLLFSFLFFTRLYKTKFLNLKIGFISYIIIFLTFIVFKIQNYMTPLFSSIGRDITFSGRTPLWDNALSLISKQPIFGYGSLRPEQIGPIIHNSSIHNCILEHAFMGGIIAIILLTLFIVFVIKQMNNTKNETFSRYLVIGIFAFLVHTLTESATNPLVYILLILASNGDYIHSSIVAKKSLTAKKENI